MASPPCSCRCCRPRAGEPSFRQDASPPLAASASPARSNTRACPTTPLHTNTHTGSCTHRLARMPPRRHARASTHTLSYAHASTHTISHAHVSTHTLSHAHTSMHTISHAQVSTHTRARTQYPMHTRARTREHAHNIPCTREHTHVSTDTISLAHASTHTLSHAHVSTHMRAHTRYPMRAGTRCCEPTLFKPNSNSPTGSFSTFSAARLAPTSTQGAAPAAARRRPCPTAPPFQPRHPPLSCSPGATFGLIFCPKPSSV